MIEVLRVDISLITTKIFYRFEIRRLFLAKLKREVRSNDDGVGGRTVVLVVVLQVTPLVVARELSIVV